MLGPSLGHIAFLSAPEIMKRWMDFNQTSTDTYLGQWKAMIRFHDLDLIFKVTKVITL